jgi:4-diphosphocytidyl-2-C-methyl-D-erythritol kinase
MRLLAPAKINLHLRVGPVRSDGYHPIQSWMCRVSLFDTLTLSKSARTGVKLRCDDRELPDDARNLAWRAAEAMLSGGGSGVEINLAKSIPIGSGLGGGSSDAARVLLAMNRLLNLGRSAAELDKIAIRLGSDVPFFLHSASSFCTGRGEIVQALPAPRAGWAILILPAISVPTGPVYRAFDELGLGLDGAHGESAERQAFDACRHWATLDAVELLPCLVNDLEAPAFKMVPALGALRQRAEEVIGRPVRMSGSGSTLYTLFDRPDEAQSVAQRLAESLQVRVLAHALAQPVNDDVDSPPD